MSVYLDEPDDQVKFSDHKKMVRHLSLRLLRRLTSLGEETVNQDLCDQGAINDLLGTTSPHYNRY